ncbi:transporter [Sulfuriferula plumbiphila]|uniref:Transporter n=1 Tax=Sulfuriferula plumbiphila TaxID=171865 RepID=A0A512L4U8_9PROT|nr:TolC family protein [Sulfuriferula plumbiphila]BBP03211.1 transporter [Sulfuriferula plumbiphila]GEP29498.1 transporter [Sulfuriferula plumbiphila]
MHLRQPRYNVRRLSALLLSAAFWLAHLPAATAQTLDFDQCVATALRQNPDLSVSRAQLDQALAGLRQAQGSRLPRLTASVNATRTNDALNAFGIKLSQRNATFNDFGASQFTGPAALGVAPDNLNHPGSVNNFNTRLEAQLPLYTGGLIEGNIEQAQAYIRAAQHGDVAARQQVIFNVLQAYQGVHSARAFVSVAKQAEAAAAAQVKTIDSLVKGGVVVKSDLLSAQVRLEDVRIQLLQARNAEAAALDQLHLLLGLPLSEPLDVGAPVMPAAIPGSAAALRALALADNPKLKAMRDQLGASQAGVKAAKAGLYPQVGLMARQDWNDSKIGFSASSYTLGGSLSWTMFDGNVTRGAVDRASAKHAEQQARLVQAENGVALQVDDSRRKAEEAEFRLAARQLAVTSADAAANLVNKRYASGVATIAELLAAQAQQDKAHADVVAAQYDLAVQRASLKLAIGKLEPDQL